MINRRWDPSVWRTDQGCRMLCLAADYSLDANSKPWWMGDNVMERWEGPDWSSLELTRSWPRNGVIWTAPSILQIDGHEYCVTGTNQEGPCPEQHGLLLDADTMEPVGELPNPPRQYRYKAGNSSWRDGRIFLQDGEWWLTITTGGFRWGCPPQVLLYRSDRWDGGWTLDRPLVDPALAFLFSELERPQLYRLADGRWCLWWSAWSHYMTPRTFVHFAVSAHPDDLLISRHIGHAVAPYGLQLESDMWCGWEWTDRESRSSECCWFTADKTIDHVVSEMEEGDA